MSLLPALPSGFTDPHKPEWRDYARCVHCGLCLNHCPTYRLWGLEADSPRGRIRQMLLVDQGQLGLGADFVKHIDQCLDCRGCETACPSGIEYGKLVEAARWEIEQHYRRPIATRLLRALVFRQLLPRPWRIAMAARAVRLYQRSGLAAFARSSGMLRALGLEEQERLMPQIDGRFFFSQLGRTFPAQGPRRARVAFFGGCLTQVTFTALNEATIRVLTANGCDVVVPAGQVCCGALCAHAGVRDVAQSLARRNLEVFLRDSFDAIVTNAAGCGSTLKEYPHLFPAEATKQANGRDLPADHRSTGGPERARQATEFSARVRDVTEFLAELGLVAAMRVPREAPRGEPAGRPYRVTYQDSCHLVHGQHVREAPRKLIRAVPGVELVEMQRAEDCCGSAGVYNVTQTAASMGILEEKMRNVRAVNPDAIVTANPGCILQLRAGVAMPGSAGESTAPAKGGCPTEVLHVVEMLDRALGR
jgi:glycolate oxidase iron-sulfur subunit